MFALCVVVSCVLSFLTLGAGLAKLNGVAQIKTVLEHVGATRLTRAIGSFEVLGAIGLVVGLVVAPVGIAAAAGLAVLFALAVGAHIRVKDPLAQWLNPGVPLAMAVAALLLRAATA